MEEYPIKLMYKPGKTNRADALSQCPDFATDPYNDKPTIALPEDLFVKPNTPVLDLGTYAHSAMKHPLRNRGIMMATNPCQICVYEIGDDIYSSTVNGDVMMAQTRHLSTLNQWKAAHGIQHRPGDLWWKEDALVVVGNNNLQRGVTCLFHNSVTAGHPGITKTVNAVACYYWWPGMKDFITQYIKGCAICQMNKVNTHPLKLPLYPI
jgi:hypothetical protein